MKDVQEMQEYLKSNSLEDLFGEKVEAAIVKELRSDTVVLVLADREETVAITWQKGHELVCLLEENPIIPEVLYMRKTKEIGVLLDEKEEQVRRDIEEVEKLKFLTK